MTALFKVVAIISMTISLFSCDQEYEPVFSESPDERVQQALDEYHSMLMDVSFGWKAFLYTGTGAGYFYYLDFNEDGRVTMLSDFNATSAGTPKESSWTLKALQNPTLSFNTYSYIHLPADPDGDVNGGTNGEGLVSDFEFAFSRITGDSVIFRGIQHGTEMVLVQATEQESNVIRDKRIYDVLQNSLSYAEANKGLRLALPDHTLIPVAFDPGKKVFGAQYLSEDASSIASFISPFTFSTKGILLRTPFHMQGHTIRELHWNGEKQVYFVPLAEPTELVNEEAPFIFELTTPLHSAIGDEYTMIQVPEGSGTHPLAGQSASFIAAYKAAAASMLDGIYQLTLREINFVFDAAANAMRMDVIISQTQNGMTTRHLAEYVYAYTISEEGIVKFTFVEGNENSWVIGSDMEEILYHLENKTFAMKYVGGVFDVLGGFFSQEDPEFYFSGYLVP